MGIFSRISDIFKSNVNDLIDRAEDPEKMVKQIILDMDKELQKSTQALGKAVASERMAEKQLNDAVRKSADWEAKAKAALAAGNTDLAKRALSQKVKADEEVNTYREMHETISNQTDAIKEQVETLKAKMAEAKSRQAMLIARSQIPRKAWHSPSAVWIRAAHLTNSTAWKKRYCARRQRQRHTPRWLVRPLPRIMTPLSSYRQMPRWTANCSV